MGGRGGGVGGKRRRWAARAQRESEHDGVALGEDVKFSEGALDT